MRKFGTLMSAAVFTAHGLALAQPSSPLGPVGRPVTAPVTKPLVTTPIPGPRLVDPTGPISPIGPAVPLLVSYCSYPSNASSAADFVEKLYNPTVCRSPRPGWPAPRAEFTRPAGSRQETQNADGRDYNCRVDGFDIGRNPDEIITFEPDAGLLWPGNILQGEGVNLGLGSLRPVSIPASKRPPLVLSVDLPMAGGRVVVPNPSDSTVTAALNTLIERAGRAGVQYGNALSYRKVDAYSFEQAALGLRLDAHYMGGAVRGRLNFSSKASEHTVTAFFVQKGFTVKVDLAGQRPAAALLGNTVAPADLVALARARELSNKNLPTYVSSITYGRVLMFNLTSTRSEQEMRSALDASYNALVAGGSGGLSTSDRKVLGESRIEVVSLGGPFAATAATIRTGDLSQYFRGSAPVNTLKPISYVVRQMGNSNAIASMSRTTSYNVTSCTPNPLGFIVRPRMYVRMLRPDDRSGDDIFGDIRWDGKLAWSLPEKQAIKVHKDQSVDINQMFGPAFSHPVRFGEHRVIRVEGRWLDRDDLSKPDLTAGWNFTIDLYDVVEALRNGRPWEGRFVGKGSENGSAELVIRFDPGGDNRPF